MRSARIAACILALAIALTLWLTGQGRGLLHAGIYLLGVLPGIPIGIRLFGRRHPAAWIAGALLGYGLLQLAIWLAIESRLTSSWEFVGVWMVLGALQSVIGEIIPVVSTGIFAGRRCKSQNDGCHSDAFGLIT